MTDPAGILTLTPEQYHADPAATPSLSSSIATILCTQSPAHAWQAHPKLNPDLEREHKDQFDLGTTAHAILLEGKNVVEVVDAKDWRTDAAKAAREEIRSRGKIALLPHTVSSVWAMVAAAREQLEAHAAAPPLFVEGKAEQTLIWEEPGGVVCRALFDWLHDDYTAIDDYKTTSRSGGANPESWSRSLFSMGADVQAAFYLRGLRREIDVGVEPVFRWAVQETVPPYALSVVSPGPGVLEIAGRKVQHAIDLWRKCLASDEWPAYPTEVCYAELPPWEEARWLALEERVA